jgi:hypothetical protein
MYSKIPARTLSLLDHEHLSSNSRLRAEMNDSARTCRKRQRPSPSKGAVFCFFEPPTGEFVWCGGHPVLPGLNDRGRVSVRLEKVEGGRCRRREGVQNKGRNHAEVAATCTAQSPTST